MHCTLVAYVPHSVVTMRGHLVREALVFHHVDSSIKPGTGLFVMLVTSAATLRE